MLEIKKKTAFTLKEDDYKSVLAKIKSANLRLNMIVSLNMSLESSRHLRSQWRLTQLVRDLSRGLFNALDEATMACCTQPHETCLKLSRRPLGMPLWSTTEVEMAKDLEFQLSLQLYQNGSIPDGSLPEQSRIYNLAIRIVDFEGGDANEDLPKTLDLRSSSQNPTDYPSQLYNTSSTPTETSGLDRKNTKLQPLLGHIARSMTKKGKAIKALARGSLDLIVVPNPKGVDCFRTPMPNPVVGLCQLVRIEDKSRRTDQGRSFYGHLVDHKHPERRFGLYAPTTVNAGVQQKPHASGILRGQPSSLPSNLTLRQLLDRTHDSLRQRGDNEPLIFLEFQEKLQLAVIIAVNVLHLYSSPWLPKILTLDDILFRLEDEATSSDFPSGFPYRVCIKKLMPWSASAEMLETVRSIPGSRKRETAVFSFGLILIQIMLGRVIDELDMRPASSGQDPAGHGAQQSASNTTGNHATTMRMDDYMEKYKLAKGYGGEVLTEAGPQYTSAVTRCLESFINIEGLQSEKFCQEYCVDVISMLQVAFEKSMDL